MAEGTAPTWTEIDAAPEQVRRAAAEYGLGSWFLVYETTSRRAAITAARVLGLVTLCLVFCALAVAGFDDEPYASILILVAMVSWASLVLRAMVRSLVHFGDQIYLLEAGLVQVHRRGTSVFPWATTQMYSNVTRWVRAGTDDTHSMDYKFTLRGPAGEALVVDNYTSWNVEQLGTRIHTAITRAQLPLAAERLARGETVTFGRFGVDQHGLTAGGKLRPWNEVHAIVHADGRIGFQWRGGSHADIAPISATPNARVFAELARTTLLATRERGVA